MNKRKQEEELIVTASFVDSKGNKLDGTMEEIVSRISPENQAKLKVIANEVLHGRKFTYTIEKQNK